MSSIVIAYEDDYHEELHLLVKALRQDRGLPGMIVEGRPVRGTGNFVHETPRLLRTPLKQTKLPPDRVVCLADADRPQDLVPRAPPAPAGADSTALDQWVRVFEASWKDHLVRESKLSEEAASRLYVCCMRWSKESLLVACPDALLEHAGGRRERVRALLDACVPAPATLGAAEFVVSYRKPTECLERVFQVIADRHYKKGRDDEDLLRLRIKPDAARRADVLSRCPDLGRLLDVLGP
ncbi:hypothetical protein [Sorangium sp. So ce854]|uniref:hypothetical protein n=1 Tax=Sorangium sp. So ce854 TaxID=3133322 RepID=UPI003F5FFF1A